MFEFEISRLDNGVKVVGELDVTTAPRLSEALWAMGHERGFFLDLSQLTFIDSFGIHTILELARARNGNGPIVILNPSDVVTRVFEILALDQHPGLELRRSTKPPRSTPPTSVRQIELLR